mmetsp:Transcript_21781/g.49577  ORF Transcript_21781/g.49577 Transcript_21781/m.49577 type:complete len:299 (+) Transcript_21781:55-951(+)
MEQDWGDEALGGDAWIQLAKKRDALVHDLHVEHASRRSLQAKTSLEVAGACQHCGVVGPLACVQCPQDLPHSDGLGRLTSWGYSLLALRTPHCRSCCSITFDGSIGPVRALAMRVALGGGLVWDVTIEPCVSCRTALASDAMVCLHCGTTSPRGAFLQQPKLQRCARCGARVACDAGLCLDCGTRNFRPAGFFSAGPSDLRMLECPSCGHDLAADAYLCVHCGASWPAFCEEPAADEDDDDTDAGSTSEGEIQTEQAARMRKSQLPAERRQYLTLVEALEQDALKLNGSVRELPCPAG